MKVKQWLASSLAVLMLVSTVGCGDNSSSSKAESKSNNSSAVVSETAMPEKDYATTTDGSAKVKIDGTKFMVGDKEHWISGTTLAEALILSSGRIISRSFTIQA